MPYRPTGARLLAALLALGLLLPVLAEARIGSKPRAVTSRIVVHAIGGPKCQNGKVVFSGAPQDAKFWKSFFDKPSNPGMHYVVDREGQVAASTPENVFVNHAQDNGQDSVGIELVNDGDGTDPFTEPQIAALAKLIREIADRHGLGREAVVTHEEIDTRTFPCGGVAVKKKQDPGPLFDKARVLDLAFGPAQ